jgi:hypothetical protein
MTATRYKANSMKGVRGTISFVAAAIIAAGCAIDQEQPADLVPLNPPSSSTTTSTTSSTTTTTIDPWSSIDWSGVAQIIEQEREAARRAHGLCGEWHDLAISVGFNETEWDVLKQIIARETGDTCRADVLNDNVKTRDNSWGLTQINTLGDLWPGRQQMCGLTEPADLLDPAVNLACARKLYERSGWAPWRYPWNTTTTTTEGPAA